MTLTRTGLVQICLSLGFHLLRQELLGPAGNHEHDRNYYHYYGAADSILRLPFLRIRRLASEHE